MKKLTTIFIAFTSLLLSACSFANHGRAELPRELYLIERVEANYRLVTSYRERQICETIPDYTHYRRDYSNRNRGSDSEVIVGAIIGGLVGRNFGSGTGRDAMTIIGSAVGANLGNNSRDRRDYHYRSGHRHYRNYSQPSYVRSCRMVRTPITERIVDGYNVYFWVDNRLDRIVVDHPPKGDYISL